MYVWGKHKVLEINSSSIRSIKSKHSGLELTET